MPICLLCVLLTLDTLKGGWVQYELPGWCVCWRSQNGPTLKEAFDRGPDVVCRFQEIQMSRVSVAYLCPCHIPEMALSHVLFQKWPCRMSISSMSHVNL